MTIQLSISKEEINELPLYQFEGNIELIDTKEQALKALGKLKNEKLLGFDTETRAAFRKGENYNISLLQLATNKDAYLFRLRQLSMIPEIIDLLTDKSIIKTGVGIKDDIKGLQKLKSFEPKSFVDLATIAKEKKIKNFGLRALTAILLKKRLSKKAKTSNWDLKKLSQSQIMYAACDAVVAFQIYEQLHESL